MKREELMTHFLEFSKGGFKAQLGVLHGLILDSIYVTILPALLLISPKQEVFYRVIKAILDGGTIPPITSSEKDELLKAIEAFEVSSTALIYNTFDIANKGLELAKPYNDAFTEKYFANEKELCNNIIATQRQVYNEFSEEVKKLLPEAFKGFYKLCENLEAAEEPEQERSSSFANKLLNFY